jgi:poly(A) polymerase
MRAMASSVERKWPHSQRQCLRQHRGRRLAARFHHQRAVLRHRQFRVLDYVGGMADLKAGLIRLIGDPVQRYHEDPCGCCGRCASPPSWGFRLDPATEAPLASLGSFAGPDSAARLFDEVLKLFLGGSALQTFELLRHYRLFGWLFPATERCLKPSAAALSENPAGASAGQYRSTVGGRQTGQSGVPVRRPAVGAAARTHEHNSVLALSDIEAMQAAADAVVQAQIRHPPCPRRHSLPMREIWEMQQRLTTSPASATALIGPSPLSRRLRFSAWWTRFLALDEAGRAQALQPSKASPHKAKSRRRRKARSARKAPKSTPLQPEI